MRIETQREIDGAIERWRKQYAIILSEEVYRQYATSAFEAESAMGDGDPPRRPDETDQQYRNRVVADRWRVVSVAAREYARQYGRMLEAEGASIIAGQKVPWMNELSRLRREQVVDIIEEGIASGVRPGTKELKRGGYSKGTVANRLQEYFGDRRSHASTVARTEVARICNVAALNQSKDRGYGVQRVTDGRSPGVFPCNCEQYDGQFWTTDYAMTHELEHPNCTRAFAPVAPEDVPEGATIVGL